MHLSNARLLVTAGALLSIGATASPAPEASGDSIKRCALMAGVDFGESVRIISSTHVGASSARTGKGQGDRGSQPALPSHCKVEGIVNERKGAGGKTYGIRFAIALPDQWSGRFLLQGGGGLNGSVRPPVGPVASGGRPALARGIAVISSDSGHEGALFDMEFMADQRAALDFAEAAVRTVALLGKQVTTIYYGTRPKHSYMTGCSTGGREGMLASQRYPELFDGIIVGAPAMRADDSNLALEYTHVLFNAAAPKDANGKPIMSQVLTQADGKTILAGLLKQCDGLDGLRDGIIENAAQCRFEPRKLQCRDGQKDGCLTAGKVNALEKGFAGPFDKAGYPIYVPMVFDTGIVANPQSYLPIEGRGPFGSPITATSIDLDARIHDIRQDAVGRLTNTNYWTNLNTYLDRGGKMILFHGGSDFWFSPLATWDWYQRAAATNGASFTDASRFYMVPGMLHCGGGNSFDNFDMLGPMIDWVENGKAPADIVAYRRDKPKESRPLCPYPGHARYTAGDVTKASSFVCQAGEVARQARR